MVVVGEEKWVDVVDVGQQGLATDLVGDRRPSRPPAAMVVVGELEAGVSGERERERELISVPLA